MSELLPTILIENKLSNDNLKRNNTLMSIQKRKDEKNTANAVKEKENKEVQHCNKERETNQLNCIRKMN